MDGNAVAGVGMVAHTAETATEEAAAVAAEAVAVEMGVLEGWHIINWYEITNYFAGIYGLLLLICDTTAINVQSRLVVGPNLLMYDQPYFFKRRC